MTREPASGLLPYVQQMLERQTQQGESDGHLLQRFVTCRDERAFAALLRRHGRLVWGVCRHVLRHEQDAEDAFQATFLVLARRAAAVHKSESLAGFLHGVAYRIAVRAKQSAAKRQGREALAATPESTGTESDLAWRELQAVLDEEVARLPEKYRDPFLLCCLEGSSRTEAAAALGLPLGTVSSRIATARRLLEERLARRGVSLPAVLTAGVLWSGSASAAVPAELARITVAAAAGQTVEALSPVVVALAKGALPTLRVARLVLSLALLLTATVLGVVGYGLSSASPVPEEPKQPAANRQASAPQERLDALGDPLPADAVARLGTTRFWCGDMAQRIAYSPDGSKILAESRDGVFVFDAASGKLLRNVRRTDSCSFRSMALAPDGSQLALVKYNFVDKARFIQIWDLTTGQVVREYPVTGHEQSSLLFSPDGKTLASHSFSSKTIHLWNPATGKEIRRWPRSSEYGDHVFQFSPDSKTLIVGDQRTIHFWNTATGKEVRRIEDHPGYCIYRVVLARDGTILATKALMKEPKVGVSYQFGNKVQLWDTVTGKMLRSIEVPAGAGIDAEVEQVFHFHFSPDTKTLAATSGAGALRVWDVATGKELRRCDRWGFEFAFSPDGKTMASLGNGHVVRLWDAATGKVLREHPGRFSLLTLSPDGHVLASSGWDQDVRLWDTATGQLQHRLPAAEGGHPLLGRYSAYPLHFSADGRTLTTHGEDGKARVWDVTAGKELQQFPVQIEGIGWQHVISPDGKTCVSIAQNLTDTRSPVLWDLATGKKRHVLNAKVWNGTVGFSPAGETLYTWRETDGGSCVGLWDTTTGQQLREISVGPVQPVFWGRFSPDGNWLACGGHAQAIVLHGLAPKSAVRRIEIPGRGQSPACFAFSSDSRTLAVGDEKGAIHLLELTSGKFRRHLTGQRDRICALVFSRDGTRLISGSLDTTALVWDLTGRLHDHPRPLRAADLDACWTDLGGADAEAAYRAIHRLAASPTETLPLLEKKLQPPVRPDPKRLARLIRDLDSDQFAVRDQAFKELAELGERAAAACRQALANPPSPEVRRSLEMLVEKQEQPRWALSAERLRLLQALEAVELAGTAEARQLLRRLADGDKELFLTREATAVQQRLSRQAGRRP